MADLSGKALQCALEGGLSVLKVSHEDLLVDGRAEEDSVEALLGAIERLRGAGAEHVLVTRAEAPALALVGETVVEVVPPGSRLWITGAQGTR